MLGGALGIGLRERHVWFLPLLGSIMPVPQFVVRSPTMLCGNRTDELLGSLRLVAGTRIAEELIAISRHNEAVVKLRLEVMLELRSIQSFSELVGVASLMEGDAESPVVAHQRSLTAAPVLPRRARSRTTLVTPIVRSGPYVDRRILRHVTWKVLRGDGV